MMTSVRNNPDIWFLVLRDYVTDFQDTITEACEAHEKNEQLEQQMQQLQADSQEEELKHQNVKQRNKELIKQVSRLRIELKNLRDGPPSESDSGERDEDDSMKPRKKITGGKHTPKYPEPPTLTDGKKPLYED